jgi:hypothetical protein
MVSASKWSRPMPQTMRPLGPAICVIQYYKKKVCRVQNVNACATLCTSYALTTWFQLKLWFLWLKPFILTYKRVEVPKWTAATVTALAFTAISGYTFAGLCVSHCKINCNMYIRNTVLMLRLNQVFSQNTNDHSLIYRSQIRSRSTLLQPKSVTGQDTETVPSTFHSYDLRSIWMLSSHLLLGLPIGIF